MYEQLFGMLSGLIWLMIVLGIVAIAIYLCKAISLYMLAKNKNLKHAWFAFVPILQDMKVYNLAGIGSKVFVFVYMIYRALYSFQVEGGVLYVVAWVGMAAYTASVFYVRFQMAKNFGANTLVCVLNMFFEPFVLLYFVVKQKQHNYGQLHKKVDDFLVKYNLWEDPNSFVAQPRATKHQNSAEEEIVQTFEESSVGE